MAGMGETFNDGASAIIWVGAAVGTGLKNPVQNQFCKWMAATMQKWYWTHKIEDLNFDREDFAQGNKKERPLVASPKKKFNSLGEGNLIVRCTDSQENYFR